MCNVAPVPALYNTFGPAVDVARTATGYITMVVSIDVAPVPAANVLI